MPYPLECDSPTVRRKNGVDCIEQMEWRTILDQNAGLQSVQISCAAYIASRTATSFKTQTLIRTSHPYPPSAQAHAPHRAHTPPYPRSSVLRPVKAVKPPASAAPPSCPSLLYLQRGARGIIRQAALRMHAQLCRQPATSMRREESPAPPISRNQPRGRGHTIIAPGVSLPRDSQPCAYTTTLLGGCIIILQDI